MKFLSRMRVMLICVILLMAGQASSQEESVLTIDFYRGGSIDRTRIKDESSVFLSLKAGWRFNSLLEIGGSMHTLATDVNAEGDDGQYAVDITMFGLDLALVDDPLARLHSAVGMGGGMGFTLFDNSVASDADLTIFGYIEPYGELRWSVGYDIVLCLTGAYRHVFGAQFADIRTTDMCGFTLQLGARWESPDIFTL